MSMNLASGETSILIWSLVLMGLVIAGFVLVSWVRNKLREPDDAASGGFTLGDLRDMHRKGQLSDEEFERAKQRLIGVLRQSPPKKP
jgi:uncharacterized membrane protein